MIYVACILVLLLFLILDIGLVTTLDKYAGTWEVAGVFGYAVKIVLAPLYILVMGVQKTLNYTFGTEYEL